MFDEARDLWRALISECNLDHVAEKLIPLPAPAIGLITEPGEEKSLTVGVSKIGGRPDLNPETAWPTWRGVPLAFMGQINLVDVAGHTFTECLPQTGLLSFFYHPLQETWGFDPEDKGSAAVFYFENPSATVARDFPKDLPKEGIFPGFPVRMGAELTLPAHDSLIVRELGLSDEENGRYWDAEMAFSESFERSPHRLLGYPNQVQNEMTMECQLVTHGINCGSSEGYKEGKKRGLDQGASDWRLLLEIGTDDNMMWGDAGSIYFWIRKQDLAERKFENCWLILQCC